MTSDIRPQHWIFRVLPQGLHPYALLARLDRPAGLLLLLYPCWWGVELARAPGHYPFLTFALFFFGALLMRGAGCTYNDLVDQDLDAQVARTATRPLPSGQVTRLQAMIFLGLQCLGGAVVLWALPQKVFVVGLGGLALLFIYPWMKRVTFWPQFVLGLAFNWGVWMGWMSLEHGWSVKPLILYGAGIFWTLGYDTIYAHQDKVDDARAGMKSTALLFGDYSRTAVRLFYGGTIFCFGLLLRFGEPTVLGKLAYACAAIHLIWQSHQVDFDDPAACLRIFQSNQWTGLLLLIALM